MKYKNKDKGEAAMFFATDLDRTLIYSKLFIEEATCEYGLVEAYNGKEISYMSLEAIALLKKLNSLVPIVPITTRNHQQYKRIQLFEEIICPELYVVNNGGTIIYKGQEDKQWTAHIKEQIQALAMNYDEALSVFLKNYKKPIKGYNKSDQLIWLIIGERGNIDEGAVQAFKTIGESKGWKIQVNGKKIYLYPECINKWAALVYIQKYYYQERIMAAGDSIFDYQMVHEADYGIVPKSAYIEESCKSQVRITRDSGLKAAVEILSYALEIVEKEKQLIEKYREYQEKIPD